MSNSGEKNAVSFGKWLVFIILSIIVISFSVNIQSAPFDPALNLQKVLGALGGIFIIVLLVERVTEIFVSIWRQAKTDQMREEIETAKGEQKTNKSKELAKWQAETKAFSLLIGFTISVVVCSAGVGLLGEIIKVDQGSKNFLRGVDIVLTSGLIAGGSDAFHQFTSALETFFVKSKKNLQKNK